MTPERWRRLTGLFDSALQQDANRRAIFLAEACADDPELRRDVERLLDSHEHAGSFGEDPAFRIGIARAAGMLEAGARLGRYEIRGFLAAGGMGEIYRAHDPQLGREVAIKILPPRGDISRDQLARFDREARAVGALNHPNILAVYDVGIADDVPYVVSELLDGETLRALLTRGRLPVDRARELAGQIASGLAAAHDKGIVHRDLKPENVFVTTDGLVKILDFGLAKQNAVGAGAAAGDASLTGHGLVVGTAGYMSPEQVRGQHADARSDVFALGAVLYEMATGERAFTGDSAVETMNAVVTGQPPDLRELPTPFDRIVPRCLEKDRERRFASMRELKTALETTKAVTESSHPLESGVAAPRRGSGQAARVVLAVLPLENLNGDEDQEYFSDGLTDEMIAQLGRLNPQRLGVIARTSAMKYKRTRSSIDVIGRELGAAYILEGAVRRNASRVRVSARLIQVSDQTQGWAGSYEREIGDMLALQSDLAQAIAGEIKVQLTPEAQIRLEKQREVVPAAYEAYLKGRYFWSRRTRDALEKSVGFFKKAIDIDRHHGAAYAGLADAYLTQLDYNHLPPRDAFVLVNRALLDALQLDETLAEPHSSLGHLRLHQFDWQAAEDQFVRAIDLNPGYGTAHFYYANLLAALGRFDEAIVEATLAIEIDPMTPNARLNRVSILYLARRYDAAIEELHETIELDPANMAPYYSLGLAYERQRKYSQAIDAFHRVGPGNLNRGLTVLAATGFTHATSGNRAEATRILDQLEAASAREYVSSYDLALLRLALGHTSEACALLSKAYDDHSSFLPFLNVDSRFDGLRTDARFQALLGRLNFPDVQKTPAPRAVEGPVPSAVEGGDRVQPMPRLRYVVATVLFIAGITAAGWFINGREQPPGPGASGRPSLAVMPFEDRSGDPALAWLSSGLPSMLITSLAQTPGLDLIGSDRLRASLTELGRDGSDRTARGEAARHAGAGAMLVGTLFKDGNDIRIDVQLEDVRSGRVVTASRQQGQDVFALVDALAGNMRAALDVDGRSEGRPLRDVTTASLPAYELYVKGMDAWHNIRRADARTFFEEAVRNDPAFALAHSQLALVLESLGESGRAQVHHRTVTGQLDRLPERQRLLAEAKQVSDSNPERALELIGRLLDRYPDEEEAYDLTVHIYSRNPSYENRTFAFLQQWGKAIPGPGSGHFHNHYGYALLDHGLYTDAEREFRAYLRVSPNEANPHDSLAELLLLTGRPENAPEHYEQALRLNPLFGFSHLGLAYAGAMSGRYEDALASLSRLEELGARGGVSLATIHLASALIRSRVGRYMEADTHVETARRIARESDDAAAEADACLTEAVLAWERRQTARAVEAARRAGRAAERISGEALRARTSSLAHLVGGTVEASTGRIESARAQLAAQRTVNGGDDAIQASWQRALAGQIALSEGRLAEAEVAFREAEPAVPISRSVQSVRLQTGFGILANNQPFRDGLARVKAARGELKEAIALYARLNQPHITARWTAMLEPRFVLAAARLADRAGERDTARAEYTRFLELWKNADEGLPEAGEARRYLGGK